MGGLSWGGGIPNLTEDTIRFLTFCAILLVVWFSIMAVTGWLAGRKGREGGMWAVLALFTGPFALAAVLLASRKEPPPEAEAARIPPAGRGRVRLLSDSQLELDVAGRTARIGGEVGARIDGRPSFSLARSTDWRWADGSALADDDRAQLVGEVAGVGRHEGWNLQLNTADLAGAQPHG
jgi:hypothetical protein